MGGGGNHYKTQYNAGCRHHHLPLVFMLTVVIVTIVYVKLVLLNVVGSENDDVLAFFVLVRARPTPRFQL